ncbi:hypothetical protein PGQ11_013451 [Apiospora arundinis]|uniref:F-box domain-containing protein n=1 Tax=Apiospora arundinis TaxID=335852 RepID=A0ABR2HPC6_9PEZI
MSKVTRLPMEVMSMILTALGDIDLKTLIVARAVSTQFHDLIETIVFQTRHRQPTESGEMEFDPFLRTEFFSIVSDLDPTPRLNEDGNPSYREFRLFETLRDLPWSKTEASREPYLRAEASWRRLCVTVGGPPITNLACVHLSNSLGNGYPMPHAKCSSAVYSEVIMLSPWLTMGCLYDALIMSEDGFNYGREHRDLFLGQRVADFSHAEYLCRTRLTVDRRELSPMYVKDAESRSSAVLQIDVSLGDADSGMDGYVGWRDLWYPWPYGDDLGGFRRCEWQGPLPLPEPESEDDDL